MIKNLLLLAILSCVIFIGCTIDNNETGCTIKFSDFSVLKVKSEMVLEEEFPFDELNIDFGSGDIILTGWSKSFCQLKIEYREYEKGDASIYIEAGKLKTKSKSKKGVHLSRVEGYVPKDVSLILDGGSGDISLQDFDCKVAELDLGSGDILVDNSSIKRLLNDTGSGDILLKKITNSDIILGDTGSGDVTLENCRSIANAKFDTGSGSVELTNCEVVKLFADTGSGDVILNNSNISERIIDTGSGDIIEKIDTEMDVY